MITIDAEAVAPSPDLGGMAMEMLPTGTVTLLLADVEGSTKLWQTEPKAMAESIARLDEALARLTATHRGVRPLEQGEGDSFVIAFARAADAIAFALDLQLAELTPIALRVGIHSGDIQLRDEANYIGPTINRTARLRDLAHGGQTVLSGVTESLVVDQLPADVTLTDLGNHPVRDLPRAERVLQLCHPGLRNEFPPLRSTQTIAVHNLPAQLTRFVGRRRELSEIRATLAENRLVTLSGVGGTGKTRLAVEIAILVASQFDDGVWFVDLAPIAEPDLVPATVVRAFGLPDQSGRSPIEVLKNYLRDRHVLIILDNCEHLLDASAVLATELLGASSRLTILTTSREQLGVAGELSWRVPSLSLTDDAVELFAERARRADPDFNVTSNPGLVLEICRRLDGLPLAIELAAARVRALTLEEILEGLQDRFRLLTGGSRTSVRRQQTLHASVDWSYALLTERERDLLRRLGVFAGEFDLDAAAAVAGPDLDARHQVLDQLLLLVDKSLLLAENHGGKTRYRLLETVRQYSLEQLSTSGASDAVRSLHRDHYAAMAALVDAATGTGRSSVIDRAELEIDNLRSAFRWSIETNEIERALRLASSLHPVWLTRGRVREGRMWFAAAFDAVPESGAVPAAPYAAALADKATLDMWNGTAESLELAREALALAREADDPSAVIRALHSCCVISAYFDAPEVAHAYGNEAAELARTVGDTWRLGQILAWQSNVGLVADPGTARTTAQEGLDLALAIGDDVGARMCRLGLGWARHVEGDIAASIEIYSALAHETDARNDRLHWMIATHGLCITRAQHGEHVAARALFDVMLPVATELGEFFVGLAYAGAGTSALAAGDAAAALAASEMAWQHMSYQQQTASANRPHNAEIAFANGDLIAARRWADEAVATTTNWTVALAFLVRARIALAEGDFDSAERDAHESLTVTARTGAHLTLPDLLDFLGTLSTEAGDHLQATRLLGAAASLRRRTGIVRFAVYDAGYEATVATLREALSEEGFDAAWADGESMTTEKVIAYAQRGRSPRSRPSAGWAALTPAEREVVRLVATGLTNKDVAAELFISPRTVQTHLTHVFDKLGVRTRTQLAQEVTRHTSLDA
jgi:predicted ATPase/class 3 adenylate cyclase/DNA-binding CsgD family transcriptional regulator